MNVSNGLPPNLYTQNTYRTNASDFANDKCSPMHYTSSSSSSSSNAYPGIHQTTAVDLYTDLYNGYSSTCIGQPADFSVELPAMDMPSAYNINNYGYESHKFNGEPNSGYFESEKKFDVSTGIDGSRNICAAPNGYMHYNNC